MTEKKEVVKKKSRSKNLAYKSRRAREKNKIRRVLKSNGYIAAEAYARKEGMLDYLADLVK